MKWIVRSMWKRPTRSVGQISSQSFHHTQPPARSEFVLVTQFWRGVESGLLFFLGKGPLLRLDRAVGWVLPSTTSHSPAPLNPNGAPNSSPRLGDAAPLVHRQDRAPGSPEGVSTTNQCSFPVRKLTV